LVHPQNSGKQSWLCEIVLEEVRARERGKQFLAKIKKFWEKNTYIKGLVSNGGKNSPPPPPVDHHAILLCFLITFLKSQ
jgi:hypothetical protein